MSLATLQGEANDPDPEASSGRYASPGAAQTLDVLPVPESLPSLAGRWGLSEPLLRGAGDAGLSLDPNDDGPEGSEVGDGGGGDRGPGGGGDHGVGSLRDGADADGDPGSGTDGADLPASVRVAGQALGGAPSPLPLVVSGGDEEFRRGYRAANGPEEALEHVLVNVLPCEGGYEWGIADYGNGYVSRAQFHPGSWATATADLAYSDPRDPYVVGFAVGRWITLVSDPGGSGGWPVCWHRGR